MKPTPEQLVRAFNQVRRPDWPWANAAELEAAKLATDKAFLLMNGCAVSMANGHPLAPVPVPIPTPALRGGNVNAPAPAVRPPVPPGPPHRRRDDPQGYSTALAASGEYARHDTE